MLPSGEVIEGVTPGGDRKVIVGLFGPHEMVFVVERVRSAWKIVAEPSLSLIHATE